MQSILLLEDEESVNRGIAFTLRKGGYQVFSASGIREAERLFEENQPHLIITDLNLPDGSGLSFIRWVRKQSDVHIICLTALDQELDQVMGYEAGADDYITKPFSLSVLTLKVSAFFKKQKSEEEGTLCSGEIRFQSGEMRVFLGTQEISLTKNEWKLLKLFLEHPRQVLSKSQLLERLFDQEGDFVDENTIAVNIRRLREKIEPNAAKPIYIKNIRGIGYVWDKECVRR